MIEKCFLQGSLIEVAQQMNVVVRFLSRKGALLIPCDFFRIIKNYYLSSVKSRMSENSGLC